MTDKKAAILDAALLLFTEHSYHAVSTNRIAKVAKVSEGLIFKHFKNKQGLLEAVIARGEARTAPLYEAIQQEKNSKARIRKALSLPLDVPVADYPFWQLQFTLKWEIHYKDGRFALPLLAPLIKAFKRLGYENPAAEAVFLLHAVEGISVSLLRDPGYDYRSLYDYLVARYEVGATKER